MLNISQYFLIEITKFIDWINKINKLVSSVFELQMLNTKRINKYIRDIKTTRKIPV